MYGYTEDWSHHHLIFSNPGTLADAVRNGSVAEWAATIGDPRFIQQQRRRGAATMARPLRPTPETPGTGIVGDWSMLPGAGAKGLANVYPAKFGFAVNTASCSDFVVFPTTTAGSSTVPTIVAYSNLYTGCSGTVPTVRWSVNLDAGTVVTSPVLSIDGSQAAFVATISSVANLVVLDMPASSTTTVSQVTTNSTTVNSASPCTAPCATWIAFNGSSTDTNSSPFYNYLANVLYVGDGKGVLHEFKNVFSHFVGGTNTTAPSEVTTAPWPVTVSSGDILTSPVYDSGTSGRIFVGTGLGETLAAVSISGSTATITKSAQISFNGPNPGVNTDPIVDSSAQKVYVAVNHGFATTTTTGDTMQPYVYQFAAGFAASALPTGAEAISPARGNFSDNQYIYGIAFDNAYYSSAVPSNPSGHLYACGLSSTRVGLGFAPELYRIPITTGALGAATGGPLLSAPGGLTISGTPLCSPITEFLNGTTDYIFLSQTGTNVTASPISCPSGIGCIMSFVVTNGTQTFSATAPTTTAHAAESFGTGGIIIDNAATSPSGTSQVYFSVLGSQSCSRTVTGSDTNGSKNITATSGIFTAGDVGATIAGTGIPAATTISTVTTSTTAVMSKNATSSNAGVTFTVTDTGGCSIQASQALLH